MSLAITDLITDALPPQASDFLVYPWLYPGRLTLMVGPTNIGKTTLTLEILAQLTKGDHLWDRYPAKQISRVLYLHAEHTLATLQEAANRRADIPKGVVQVIHDFGANGPSIIDAAGRPAPLYLELRKFCQDFQPELIIAEPISAFIPTNENDNREARTVVCLLADLGALCGAAVLTHHHVGKSHFDADHPKPEGIAAGEARGAMAFEDASESVVYLKRVSSKSKDQSMQVRIETPKAKGFPISPVTLSFNQDTLTYEHVTIPFQERDIIAIYDRMRKYPNEKITDLIAYFAALWNRSNTTIMLMIRRAERVGLIKRQEVLPS